MLRLKKLDMKDLAIIYNTKQVSDSFHFRMLLFSISLFMQ